MNYLTGLDALEEAQAPGIEGALEKARKDKLEEEARHRERVHLALHVLTAVAVLGGFLYTISAGKK